MSEGPQILNKRRKEKRIKEKRRREKKRKEKKRKEKKRKEKKRKEKEKEKEKEYISKYIRREKRNSNTLSEVHESGRRTVHYAAECYTKFKVCDEIGMIIDLMVETDPKGEVGEFERKFI